MLLTAIRFTNARTTENVKGPSECLRLKYGLEVPQRQIWSLRGRCFMDVKVLYADDAAFIMN